MWKRIFAGVLSLLGAVATLGAIGLAMEITEDLRNSEVSFGGAAAGEAIVWVMAIVALGITVRLAQFTWTGQTKRAPVSLIALGLFFPGFVVALPIALLWATHASARNDLDEIQLSVVAGIATSILGFVVLRRKRSRRATIGD